MSAESLVKSFGYTADIIRQQVIELSHSESLLQPQPGGHSINWLLGHIVSSRSTPLKHLGEAQVWNDDNRARYRDGSMPIGADEPGVLALDQLVELFDLTQHRLLAGLARMPALDLSKPSGYADHTVAESLLYFHFHEAYHVGQMTMVAEYLGKNAKYVSS